MDKKKIREVLLLTSIAIGYKYGPYELDLDDDEMVIWNFLLKFYINTCKYDDYKLVYKKTWTGNEFIYGRDWSRRDYI